MKTRQFTIWVVGCFLVAASALGSEPPATTGPVPQLPLGRLAPATPPQPYLSGWATEIMRLSQAGIDTSVTLAYVTNTAGTFNLASDQIIYLRDAGVPNEVISAMLQHDLEITSGLREVPASTAPVSMPPLTFVASSPASVAAPAAPALSSPQAPAAAPPVTQPATGVAPELPHAVLAPQPTQPAQSVTDGATPYLVCARDRTPPQPEPLYRVREPYPVQLTAPILVYRGASRVANTMTLQMFP